MTNHIGIYIKLHKVNDAALIRKLQTIDNKQGYIKDLISADQIKLYKYAKEKG